VNLRPAVLRLLVVVFAPAGPVFAPPAAAAQCGPDLAAYEGYRLRTVRVNSPLSFLRTVSGALHPLQAYLPPSGSRLQTATVAEALARMRASSSTPAPVGAAVAATVMMAYIDDCDDQARELDLIFYVFTTDLAAAAAFSWEFGETLRKDPAIAMTPSRRSRFTLEPSLRFDESDKVTPGAQVAFVHPSGLRLLGQAEASSRYTSASLGASGTLGVEAPALWQLGYGGGYHFQREPVERDELRQGYGFGWLSAMTRPLPHIDGPLRYAMQIETGFQDSQLRSSGFSSDQHYTAAKLLVGIAGGRGPHDYSLSAGFQLGSDRSLTPAWHKVLLDGTYGIRVVPSAPLFDHRALDVSSRFGAGWLTPLGGGQAPQNERFFGGVRSRRFTDIPDWDLRSTPVMRGYPSNRFFATLTGDPSGREHFVSLSLTAAVTGWRRPLLPKEVYTNDQFLGAIEAEKGGGRATLLSYHESRDPAVAEAEGAAALVEQALTALEEELGALSVPADLAAAGESCRTAVDDALGTVQKARERKTYRVLLTNVQSLASVSDDCRDMLASPLATPEMRAAIKRIEEQRAVVDDIFKTRVDRAAAERKAAADFAIVNRALDALVHEINLVSLDPVLVFDTAHVGPAPTTTFVRYSVGGGLRLTLGSVAAFTVGYAANPDRGAHEPAGAFFVDLKVFDLFR